MLSLLALLLSCSPPAVAADVRPIAPAHAREQKGEDKALKALDAWLKLYRAGKINFRSHDSVGKESIADKFGIMPKGLVGEMTAQRDLEIILEQVAKIDSAAAVEAVCEVAAIGLDQSKVAFTVDMAPFAVRAVGERFLVKCAGTAALDWLGKAGRGEVKFDKAIAAGMRAAALRFQGLRKEGADRGLLERNLAAAEVPVRIACAEALQMLADEAAVPALAAAVDRETNDLVLGALAQALNACFAKYLTPTGTGKSAEKPTDKPEDKPADKPADKPEDKPADKPAAPPAAELPESSRIAARAVIKAIGRTTWRADMALVQFLYDYRTKEAVPALIGVLQRFKEHPEDVQSGKLSGLLLHRAHETLVSMTGSLLPADAPEKWRELWEKDKETIALVPREAAKPASKGDTVSRNFCGIPVQGSRVLFIVDLSGSMGFPMKSAQSEVDANKVAARIDFAKKQLRKAITEMPETSRFNFITYNGNPKAEVWNKDLLIANGKNKDKALEFVDKMRADGGTNMWAGLEEGLKMKSLVYGDRYETNIDEVFLVSDGAPSVGEIVDPVEILRLVTETNRFSKVRINTIFITSPNDRDPRTLSLSPSELMRRMAEQNGGKFVEFKD